MLPNKRSRATQQSDSEPSAENAQSPAPLPPRQQRQNRRSIGSSTSSIAPRSSATERSNRDESPERLTRNQRNNSPITISDNTQSADNYEEELREHSTRSQAESRQQTPPATTHRPWSPSAVRDPIAPVQNTPVYYRVNDTPATFVIFGYVYEVDENSLAGLRRVGHENNIAPHLYPHHHRYYTAPTYQESSSPRQASPATYQPSPSSRQATPVYQPSSSRLETPVYQPSSSRQASNTYQQSSSPAAYQSPGPSYVFPTYVPVTTRSPVNAFNPPGSSRQHGAAFYNPATPQAQSSVNQRAESANVDGASPESNYPSYYPGSPSRAAAVNYTEDYFNQRDFIERLENEAARMLQEQEIENHPTIPPLEVRDEDNAPPPHEPANLPRSQARPRVNHIGRQRNPQQPRNLARRGLRIYSSTGQPFTRTNRTDSSNRERRRVIIQRFLQPENRWESVSHVEWRRRMYFDIRRNCLYHKPTTIYRHYCESNSTFQDYTTDASRTFLQFDRINNIVGFQAQEDLI